MKVTAPKNFTNKNVCIFLQDISSYFSYEGKSENNFVLDVLNIRKISLFGQLLLYKFISYTAEKKCFNNPSINGLYQNTLLREELGESGFWPIILAYINSPDNQKAINKSYSKLQTNIKDNFLLAPLKLLRVEEESRTLIENEYFQRIYSFYNDEKARTICFCLGELLTNFWSHATEDTGTIMVAKGNADSIDIYFADTGEGIINSLIDSNIKYKTMNKKNIMKLALEKNITSKPHTSHLGMGLYMIKCIVAKTTNSTFKIISDTVEYSQERNIQGMFKDTSYWKGTITYLHLDVKSLLPLDQIQELYTPTVQKLKFI